MQTTLDAIIVLGTHVSQSGQPGPVLERRLQTAATYLRKHPQTRCIVTGGKNPKEPVAEATCMARWLEANGISADRIVREEYARTTTENIALSRLLLFSSSDGATSDGPTVDKDATEKDAGEKSVGIVTSDFHCHRAMRIARKQGLADARAIPASTPIGHFVYNVLREAVCLVVDRLNGNL